MASYQMWRHGIYYVVPDYKITWRHIHFYFIQCYDNFRTRIGLHNVIFVLKLSPCHEQLRINGGIAPCILKFSTSLRRMDRFTICKLYYLK
jgi:hypothetical protein